MPIHASRKKYRGPSFQGFERSIFSPGLFMVLLDGIRERRNPRSPECAINVGVHCMTRIALICRKSVKKVCIFYLKNLFFSFFEAMSLNEGFF